METNQLAAMLAHCDELTRDGKELSITWEGGNDEGYLTLRLDGYEINELSPIEEQIIQLAEEYLGYGSFAGDFSTDGSAIYNREDKCFVGQDTYTETNQDIQECNIEFSIPEEIWFDRLELGIEAGAEEKLSVFLSLNIVNGPYPEAFDELKARLEFQLTKEFFEAARNIQHYAGIWEHWSLTRKDFRQHEGKLNYKFDQFQYSYYADDIRDIEIPLSVDGI